jgi:predicted RNA-binding Zn-ribbon protein involved in translation (DUF1610 family)
MMLNETKKYERRRVIMFVQGKCYKCGGFLAVDETQDASLCPFCGKPFIVGKAINCYNENSTKNFSVNNTSGTYDSVFVVERSVLVRFNGYTQKDITIPDGITVIGDTAFQGMNNIESVYIPDGIELIREGAFSGCKRLSSVRIPDSVEIIDRDVFNGCVGLKSVKLPDSVRKLESGVFAGCTGLEEVNIPQSVKVLPWRVFEGCTSLRSVTIPRGLNTIEDSAFAECTALENIYFECIDADGDTSAGVKRIGMNAFMNCTALESIDIPETVERIGNQAFRGCTSLRELFVPGSIKAIYPLAFADCTDLERVTFEGGTDLYKGSNPYKNEKNSATFLNCPKLLGVTYSKAQENYWAFPAYTKSQEPVNIQNGKCRYCGGDFKGIFEKVCSICKAPKDY